MEVRIEIGCQEALRPKKVSVWGSSIELLAKSGKALIVNINLISLHALRPTRHLHLMTLRQNMVYAVK